MLLSRHLNTLIKNLVLVLERSKMEKNGVDEVEREGVKLSGVPDRMKRYFKMTTLLATSPN